MEENLATSDKNIYKYVIVVIEVLLIIFIVLVCYSIIWYERFGTDNKRTLVNKFVSAICWTGICWHLTVQVIILIRFLYRPFNYSTCFWYVLSRRTLTSVSIMFLNAITLSRYIFIFWLKNPAIFNDDFWSRMASLWIVGFCFLVKFVYGFLLGSDNVGFGSCVVKPVKISRQKLCS